MFCVRFCVRRLPQAFTRDIIVLRPTQTTFALVQRCGTAMWLPSPSLLHTARTPSVTAAACGTPRPPLRQATLLPAKLPAASRSGEASAGCMQSFSSRSLSTAISASSQELAPPTLAQGGELAGAEKVISSAISLSSCRRHSAPRPVQEMQHGCHRCRCTILLRTAIQSHLNLITVTRVSHATVYWTPLDGWTHAEIASRV